MGAVLPEQPLSLHFLPTLSLLALELASALLLGLAFIKWGFRVL